MSLYVIDMNKECYPNKMTMNEERVYCQDLKSKEIRQVLREIKKDYKSHVKELKKIGYKALVMKITIIQEIYK